MTFMTHFVMSKDMATFKQGYLHIKRERHSPAVTSVLFKPWQTGYFCLYKNPYTLKEYKDSSLKHLKQTHFVGTIKHVSVVNTSKSQPYALEVLMEENAPLLLACDNDLLRAEWIKAFTDIIDEIAEKRMKNAQVASTIKDAYMASIVDTALSEATNLHGEYLMVLGSNRVFLFDSITQNDILSWPLSHVTFHTGQPSRNKITLIMGRHCHFGSGKLIFESHNIGRIISYFDQHFQPNKKPTPQKVCYSFTSSSSSSVTSESSLRSSPDTFRFSTRNSSKDESFEQSVFDSPTIPEKPYPELSVSDVKFAIGVDDEDRDVEMNDTHEEEETHARIIFGKITSEDKYVQPNEPDEDLVDSIKSHIENRKLSGKELSNIQEAIIEEDACSTYVHLIDDDDDEPSDLTTHELFESITKSLENPQQHNFADHHGKYVPTKSKSLHIECNAAPKNNEIRRASEPTKSIYSVQRIDHKKKLQKESFSVDHEHENQTTPKGSPFSFRKKTTAVKQNSFPKNNSISQHNSQAISAFNIGEKLFTTYDAGITSKTDFSKFQKSKFPKRQNVLSINKYPTSKSHPNLKLPDLDRNTKPKTLPSNNDTRNKSSNESIASEEDSPPPIPERQLPIVRNGKKQSLQRCEEVDKSDDDILTEQLATEKKHEGMTLLPPPLPPKSKPLQLTKSAPLSQSQSFDDEEPRRSSFSTLPREEKEETDEPPTIPSRDHIPMPMQSKSTSACDITKEINDFNSTNGVILETQTASKSLAKSLDGSQFPKIQKESKQVIISTDTHNEILRTHTNSSIDLTRDRKFSSGCIPSKLLDGHSNSGFPKSPQSFF